MGLVHLVLLVNRVLDAVTFSVFVSVWVYLWGNLKLVTLVLILFDYHMAVFCSRNGNCFVLIVRRISETLL